MDICKCQHARAYHREGIGECDCGCKSFKRDTFSGIPKEKATEPEKGCFNCSHPDLIAMFDKVILDERLKQAMSKKAIPYIPLSKPTEPEKTKKKEAGEIKTVKGHGYYKCPECECDKIGYCYSIDYQSEMGTCKQCLCHFKIEYDGFFENNDSGSEKPSLEELNKFADEQIVLQESHYYHKPDEKLYEYCSGQMDMMLEDLERDGKLKDEKLPEPIDGTTYAVDTTKEAEPEKELLYSLDDMKELKEIAEERERCATRKELIEEFVKKLKPKQYTDGYIDNLIKEYGEMLKK